MVLIHNLFLFFLLHTVCKKFLKIYVEIMTWDIFLTQRKTIEYRIEILLICRKGKTDQ